MIKKSRMARRVLTKVADVTDKNLVENMVKSIVETMREVRNVASQGLIRKTRLG
jgi:hypothetical protein